jgi:hypothetical protein
VSYKRGLAVVFGGVIAGLVSFAATYPRFFPENTAAVSSGNPPATKAAPPALAVEIPGLPSNPLSWANLTDAEHVALAPFAGEWDSFSDERKRKWIKIASRYAKMSPEAQKRLHDRMTEWVRMTPDQRRVARENYQVSKQVSREARQKAWKAYQQLPEDQKERLAATERKRRPTVVSAPPSGKTELKDIDRLLNAREHAASGTVPRPTGFASEPATAAPAGAGSLTPVPSAPMPASETPAVFRGS